MNSNEAEQPFREVNDKMNDYAHPMQDVVNILQNSLNPVEYRLYYGLTYPVPDCLQYGDNLVDEMAQLVQGPWQQVADLRDNILNNADNRTNPLANGGNDLPRHLNQSSDEENYGFD